MEYKEIKERLEKDYYLVPKGKLAAFLGGALAFVIAAGVISYQGALNAIESNAGKKALESLQQHVLTAKEGLVSLETMKKQYGEELKELKGMTSRVRSLEASSHEQVSILKDMGRIVDENTSVLKLVRKKGKDYVSYGESFNIVPYFKPTHRVVVGSIGSQDLTLEKNMASFNVSGSLWRLSRKE